MTENTKVKDLYGAFGARGSTPQERTSAGISTGGYASVLATNMDEHAVTQLGELSARLSALERDVADLKRYKGGEYSG